MTFTHLKPKNPDEIKLEISKLSDYDLFKMFRFNIDNSSSILLEVSSERWGKDFIAEIFEYENRTFVTISSKQRRSSVTFPLVSIFDLQNIQFLPYVPARLIATELINVVPMDRPIGTLMYLDYVYDKSKIKSFINFKNLIDR